MLIVVEGKMDALIMLVFAVSLLSVDAEVGVIANIS